MKKVLAILLVTTVLFITTTGTTFADELHPPQVIKIQRITTH